MISNLSHKALEGPPESGIKKKAMRFLKIVQPKITKEKELFD